MEQMKSQEWKAVIRKVPDFPKPGILYFDITSIFLKPDVYKEMLDAFCEKAKVYRPDFIASVEARGFLFGAPLALMLGIPFIPIRKKNKLPGKVREKSFSLEYGKDIVAIHEEDVPHGGRCLLVDDLAATGGTLNACCEMIEECGAEIAAVGCVIGLPFLSFRKVLKRYPVFTLVDFQSENREEL